jgi:hypothetical protein
MLEQRFFPIHDLAAIAVTERRRQTPRHACSLRAAYALLLRPQLAALPGTVENISGGGICMRVGYRLARGTLLTVKIYASSGDRCLSRPAQVRYARPGPWGTWLVGLAFGR